ncbi:MAG: hypothetical protein GX825_05275 [Syntrophomonadaceae bacterium]|jgi:gamma-glutamyltranspeptidase/glutathione hydrolase|nr:hypothetical protein [Syntrophomonadaceae bacterium]
MRIQIRLIENHLQLTKFQIFQRAILNFNGTAMIIVYSFSLMKYSLQFSTHTSGPLNAIYFDHEHGTFWGGSSNYGEDYGIGW